MGQEELSEGLFDAARKGDWKRLIKLVGAGVPVNQMTDHGWTPLAEAVVGRHLRCSQILLEHGANPQLGEQYEGGAFHFACGWDEKGSALVKLLVEHGVPPDYFIHAAVERSRVGTVRQLLKRGADPNLLDHLGELPLRCARSPAMIRLLFKHGADPLARNTDNSHPLGCCSAWGKSENVKALLAGGVPADYPEPGPPDQPDIRDGFPLQYAFSFQHFRCIKALLEAGANPQVLSDYHVETPLIRASRWGSPWLVRLFLAHGADPRTKCYGKTAQEVASEFLPDLFQKVVEGRPYCWRTNAWGEQMLIVRGGGKWVNGHAEIAELLSKIDVSPPG